MSFWKKHPAIGGWTLGVLTLASVVYYYAHDEAEPDLSRFVRPAHDPVAYARVKQLAAEFQRDYRKYKPVDPADPDDDKEPDEAMYFRARVLRREPDAMRAMRRYLDENKAALVHAEALVSLAKVSYAPPRKGRPWATGSDEISTRMAAVRLVTDAANDAAMAGDLDAAWRYLGKVREGSAARRAASGNLVAGLTALAADGELYRAVPELAYRDDDATRIRRAAVACLGEEISPSWLKQIWAGEIQWAADGLLASRGGEIRRGLSDIFSMPKSWRECLNSPMDSVARGWENANFRPHATMRACVEAVEPYWTHPVSPVEGKPKPRWINSLAYNCGGRAYVAMTCGAYESVHSKVPQFIARHRLTRVAVALRLWQLEHGGKYPARLSDLVPAYLPAVPTDPFGGAEVRYDAASGKVWSLGQDLKDGGGDAESDVVVAPPVLALPKAAGATTAD